MSDTITKPVMTVLMYRHESGVLTRGISEDHTIFTNVLYTNANYAVEMIGRHYSKAFRVVFEFPIGDPS